jgi:hypothetical protein
MTTADVVTALEGWGAAEIPHPGGTLLDHLRRTEAKLRSWAAPDDLALAGLCHAAYGTDSFAPHLLPLDGRPTLVTLIGSAAEDLVYRYASWDRPFVYPQLGTSEVVAVRNRFDGSVTRAPAVGQAPLVELTFANELDINEKNRDFAVAFESTLAPMFARCRELVSAAAYQAFEGRGCRAC